WCQTRHDTVDTMTTSVNRVDAPVHTFELGVRHQSPHYYVEFMTPGRTTFHGFWQQCSLPNAPVLFHLPGYGAEMSAHPSFVAEGFHVLHINSLGTSLQAELAVKTEVGR
ncbi:MAG: hypothetical protein QGH20_06560, partial [Candidatus Latescibacteria bacterium]|nr:hypothetical protein [Candidatus Latescibacterota bacterium]